MIVTLQDMAEHQQNCNGPAKEQKDKKDVAASTPEEERKNGGEKKEEEEEKKGFYCDVCKKHYSSILTPMQVLRHKKTHS